MIVRFWGTRGSVPVTMTSAALRRKLVTTLVQAAGRAIDTEEKARAFVEHELDFCTSDTFGGNTSCVQLDTGGGEYVLCDLGSGARPFGLHVLAAHGSARPNTFHIFMSHAHWDHIMGFPFFMPAYMPGNRIRIYGCHADLEVAFRRQHGAPSFPVDWSMLGASIEFVRLVPGKTHEVAGLSVTPKLQRHGGDSYGYRFEAGGRSVVYSTDSEHKLDDSEETRAFVDFFHDADLVILDAQYSLAEAVTIKADWGHSSNIVGVELTPRKITVVYEDTARTFDPLASPAAVDAAAEGRLGLVLVRGMAHDLMYERIDGRNRLRLSLIASAKPRRPPSKE